MKTSFLNTGQLGLAPFRHIIAGEMAGAWTISGSPGAMLTNMAHLPGLSVVRNMGTASRSEPAQSIAWTHLVRDCGNLRLSGDELIQVYRGRLRRCIANQVTEYADSAKPGESYARRPSYSRNAAQKRSESRQRIGSSQRATKLPTYNRRQSPYFNKYRRSPENKVKAENAGPEKWRASRVC